MEKQVKIKRLLFLSYLAMIKNSVGSKMFQNFYAKVNGQKKDVMEKGNLSCAFFVSSVLFLFKFINGGIHGTVVGLEKDLKESGWRLIKKPKIGSVIVWEPTKKSNYHLHIGFYIGKNLAVSNDQKTRKIIQHHFTFENKRKIERIYWLDGLERL